MPISSSSSPETADSYIGSIISLTSKFEIRYEGILCSLNPHDSTLGLKYVRSFGTEGRKKDGPEIPPSDKLYEYILFRGSDIKDLQVKSSLPSPVEESIHSDPAIIESQFSTGTSSSSKPVALNNEPLIESSPYQEASVVKLNSYSNVPPRNYHSPQVGAWGSATAQIANYSTNALPADWLGHNVAASPNACLGQQPMTSKATQLSTISTFPMASSFQVSTAISSTKFSNSMAPMPSLAASNSLNSRTMSPLTPGQLSTYPLSENSLPMMASLPTYPPDIFGNQLNMVALTGMNSAKVESVNLNENIPFPAVVQPSQSLSYTGSALVDSMTGNFLKHSPLLLTPDQLSQPRMFEFPPALALCPDEKKMEIANSNTALSTLAAQAPLRPSHPSTEQFTEEFDFEAMNQKFNKNEVWGLLGSAKRSDKGESIDDNDRISQLNVNDDGGGLMPATDSKPAYKKDDFFDTISCNSTSHRPRNRQNPYSERMRFDSKTFDNFQQRSHPEFGDYGGGRPPYHPRGSYGWGRGYNSGGRGYNSGRGGHVQW